MCISEHKKDAGSSIAAGIVTHVGQFLSKVSDKGDNLGLLDGG